MENKIIIKADDVEIDIVELEKKSLAASALADELAITDDKGEAFAIDALADIKDYAKRVEATRKEVVKKPNDFVDRINGIFKPVKESFDSATKKITIKLSFYRDQKRILAEEKKQRELEVYQAKVENEKIEAARQQRQEKIIAPPITSLVEEPKTVRTGTAKATFVEFNDYEVVDIHAVYAAFPELVKLEIRRKETLEALKTREMIPGLTIFKNSSIRS
jgi:hypothetical protein